jgi:TolB protein
MIWAYSGESIVKSLRQNFMSYACMAFGLLFTCAGLAAQNPSGAAAAAPKYRTHFVVYDVEKNAVSTLFIIEGEWHAPNPSPDGNYIVSDMGGALYRIPMDGANKGKPEKIYENEKVRGTNDHAVSWDGKQIAITGITLPLPAKIRNAGDIHNPILIMNLDGSNSHEIHLGWLHGWSPDGKYVVYTGFTEANPDVFRVDADGKNELRMTTDKALDDGPEYSADGKWVYFCSNRSGKWDGWRIPAGGAGPDDRLAEKITNGTDTQDWFPHISPDGRWLYTISYPIDHPDHSFIGGGMKIKLLKLENGVAAKGAELTTVRTFFGGQGSGNTGGWMMDSKKFAWTEYEKIGESTK